MPSSRHSATKKYDNVIAVDRLKPWIPPGGASDDTPSESDGDGDLPFSDSSEN